MHSGHYCARCGDSSPAVFCVEGNNRVARCANHHVTTREPIDRGAIAHNKMTTWLRQLEQRGDGQPAPRY